MTTTPRVVGTNGVDMSVLVAGEHKDGALPVVLLHGFPELAFSWRHQIAPLVEAGCLVIAPDLRGYGDTGAVGEVGEYRMTSMEADLTGLLDALEIPRAVLVGHDFGGWLAWAAARDHPDRVLGIASLNTPYTRRGREDLISTIRRTRGEQHYMVTFQEPGVAESMLEADVDATFRRLMVRPDGSALLSDDERAVFVSAFSRTGFTGGLNWYRNMTVNWEDTAGVPDLVTVPGLMISAADDAVLPPSTTAGMERFVPDLERHVIAGCGHWTQQEQPAEVNRLLVDWLTRRFAGREIGL